MILIAVTIIENMQVSHGPMGDRKTFPICSGVNGFSFVMFMIAMVPS
jgi:hypothetical protein